MIKVLGNKVALFCVCLVVLLTACEKKEASVDCKNIVDEYGANFDVKQDVETFAKQIDEYIHKKIKDKDMKQKAFMASCLVDIHPDLDKAEVVDDGLAVKFYYAKDDVWGKIVVEY